MPLFWAILVEREGAPGDTFPLGLYAFAMLHVGLHWLYRRHPAYEFNTPSSWALILVTGTLGAAYVAVAPGA